MCLISAVALLKACDWPSGHSAASGLDVLRKWVGDVCVGVSRRVGVAPSLVCGQKSRFRDSDITNVYDISKQHLKLISASPGRRGEGGGGEGGATFTSASDVIISLTFDLSPRVNQRLLSDVELL